MVERRDAGRCHSHEYFPVCNRRFWQFDQLQPLITTKCFGSHCTHIISPLIQAFIPPSTIRFAPVMYEDSGPATNATSCLTRLRRRRTSRSPKFFSDNVLVRERFTQHFRCERPFHESWHKWVHEPIHSARNYSGPVLPQR